MALDEIVTMVGALVDYCEVVPPLARLEGGGFAARGGPVGVGLGEG